MTQPPPEPRPGSRFLEQVPCHQADDAYLPRHLSPDEPPELETRGARLLEPALTPSGHGGGNLPASPVSPGGHSFPGPADYAARRATLMAEASDPQAFFPRVFGRKVDPARLVV